MSTGLPDNALWSVPGAAPTATSDIAAVTAGGFAVGFPRLLADVGGTNARFALQLRHGGLAERVNVYACEDFPGIAEAIERYLADVGAAQIVYAVIAIANPVDGDQVSMTNNPWRFSIEATRARLTLSKLLVVNDFEALAMAVPTLGSDGLRQLGGGTARAGAAVAVVGPGTGLGVAGLLPVDGRWLPIASEGGHASFSPCDERDERVLHYARRHRQHVSFERIVSGPGLALIYTALMADRPAAQAAAAEVAAAASSQTRALASTVAAASSEGSVDAAAVVARAKAGDAIALEAVDVFCGALGTFASNVTLTFGARGGLYIGGGVVLHLGQLFYGSSFRQRFEDKGRFSELLKEVPTFVIVDEFPAFAGASAILSDAVGR
ncbi:MAG: glucokinase [Janthinobacterium lividum]